MKAFFQENDNNKVIVGLPILCCDTLIYHENKLIGKAHSSEEAFYMLKELSNRSHFVYTGFSLFFKGKEYSGFDMAKVTFKKLKENSILDYLKTKEWEGAAGSYRIQGSAKAFIDTIEGDITTVIGLPLKVIFDIIENAVNNR